MINKKEVYDIVGAAMQVYKELGCGFLEGVYHEALEIELADRGVPFESHKSLEIQYKGRRLKKEYCADLVCYEKIIVELKALDRLTSKEESQILNYLKASGLEAGVLINFGAKSLEWERFFC